MKKITILVMMTVCMTGLVNAQQNVGIGTTEPVSMLTVARGIHIDLDNVNNFALESAITFGNSKLVGIGSQRLSGNNTQGLDFYTAGARRLCISADGLVGIGTSLPNQRLTVVGNTYINGNTGLGISSPAYSMHTNIGFVTTRLGIGTAPTNTTYALNVLGSTLLDGNTRNTGFMVVEDYLQVRNNRGIVRSNSSLQYKIVPFTAGGLSVSNIGNGGTATSVIYTFPEAFSSPPVVMVSHLAGGNFTGSGNPYSLWMIPREVTSTGCKFEVVYLGASTVSGTNISFSCMALGRE